MGYSLTMNSLTVALAGVLGVLSRYWLGVSLTRWIALPLPTFTINVSGALLAGFVATLPILSDAARTAILVGFLGGFTTFSAYTVETLRLWQDGQIARAALYWIGSPTLGLIAAAIGIQIGRRFS